MILLTGAAGFIGFHTARALLERGEDVVGIDSVNNYYDVNLKQARLDELEKYENFTFHKVDIGDHEAIQNILNRHPEIDQIIHLAAQAGVRYSIDHPFVYEHSNLKGHMVMLEVARSLGDKLRHFVYASSSSVYGSNQKQPFSIHDPVDTPISLYAATKRAAELMTQTYCHLYQFPATGLRFFTVYGPWGRPDMAYFSFTDKIYSGAPITVFNNGDMKRDFTYIDDIVAGVLHALEAVPKPDDQYCIDGEAHRIFNLGNNNPDTLMDFIQTLENAIGKEAEKKMAPMQPGDVYETYADIDASRDILGFEPKTSLQKGIPHFIEWYKTYYKVA